MAGTRKLTGFLHAALRQPLSNEIVRCAALFNAPTFWCFRRRVELYLETLRAVSENLARAGPGPAWRLT